MRRTPQAVWMLLLIPGALYAQTFTVSPKALRIQQVEGGPLASAGIQIRSSGDPRQEWTATVSHPDADDSWIRLSATSGVTPSTVIVEIVGWRGERRKPGKYTGKITIVSRGASETVPVEWEVRAALPGPSFTYKQGLNGCTKADGYPDLPLCTPLPAAGLVGIPLPGAAYVDPNFGAPVRVVTGPDTHHPYSTPSPLSAHNKYLIILLGNGTADVIDAVTGTALVKRTSCNQGCFWDAFDDEVYYSLQAAAIIKHEVRANKTSTLIDYAKQPEAFHEIARGGTGDTSKDNWISFWAPDEKQICAIDLTHVKTWCADYSASQRRLHYGDIDFTLITKGVDRESGKRYVILVAPPAMGVFSVDMAAGVLKPEYRGPEDMERNGNRNGICDPGERCVVGSHVDTLEDAAGIQYLVMNAETIVPCEVSLSTYQLNKGTDLNRQVELGGGRKKVMSLWRCGPGWVDEHVGCAKAAPYCVISTESAPRRPGDQSPLVPTPHGGMIFLMRGNGDEVRPLALSRSVIFTDGGGDNYWAAPRSAISSDASLVVSDSNFGDRQTRVTVIETGVGTKQ
jgi:hypothetical protein